MGIRVTGIGSLPYKNIQEALEFSFRHDVPFLPELPQKSQNEMIHFSLKSLPCSYEAFTQMALCQNKRGECDEIKVQMIDPLTALMAQKDSLQEIIKTLLERAKKTLLKLESFEGKILFFLDSPSLFLLEKKGKDECEEILGSFSKIFSELKKDSRIQTGLHSCSRANFTPFLLRDDLPLDILSFDASLSRGDLIRKGEEVDFFFKKGGVFAYGLSEKCHLDQDEDKVDYLTYSCGLGTLKVSDCDRILFRLHSLAQSYR